MLLLYKQGHLQSHAFEGSTNVADFVACIDIDLKGKPGLALTNHMSVGMNHLGQCEVK